MQRKLCLLGESSPLVLCTVSAARDRLPGHDEDDLKSLWEEGRILYAWNIGLGESIDARLLPDAIDHYARTQGKTPYPRTEDQVLAQLCMSAKPWLTTTQLKIMLNCGATHIMNLIEAGQLKLQPGTQYGRGGANVALITIPSIKNFLKQRRLP